MKYYIEYGGMYYVGWDDDNDKAIWSDDIREAYSSSFIEDLELVLFEPGARIISA